VTLSMIAHGTDGSDGLEAGIHLRWSFDQALGFPLCSAASVLKRAGLDIAEETYTHKSKIYNF